MGTVKCEITRCLLTGVDVLDEAGMDTSGIGIEIEPFYGRMVKLNDC